MVRRITETLYCIHYYGGNQFVEISTLDELAEFVAEMELVGCIVTSVTKMCLDGSTPRIAVKSMPSYKKAIKDYQKPKTVYVEENYRTNDRGCHYSLTPCEEYKKLLSQFQIDTTSLKEAKEECKKWIERMEKKNNIKIVIKKKGSDRTHIKER